MTAAHARATLPRTTSLLDTPVRNWPSRPSLGWASLLVAEGVYFRSFSSLRPYGITFPDRGFET